jgi:hypothetical protein
MVGGDANRGAARQASLFSKKEDSQTVKSSLVQILVKSSVNKA